MARPKKNKEKKEVIKEETNLDRQARYAGMLKNDEGVKESESTIEKIQVKKEDEVEVRDDVMTLLQFSAHISDFDPRVVVQEFIKLCKEGRIKSENACIKELKRLGYSTELIQNKLVK